MKENLGTAAEWFDIALMLWNKGNDFRRDSVFAAEVRKWANHDSGVA